MFSRTLFTDALTDAHVSIWSSVTYQHYRPLWHHLWPLIGQSPPLLASDWSTLSGRLGHSFNIKDCDQLSLSSAQCSGKPFYCITSSSVQILDIFQTLHNVRHFRVRSLVSVSLPASWSSECARPRGEAGARAGVVSPDMVIVSDDSDDSDDTDGGVTALQHLGCGHQGLQVTVSQRMFRPSLSVMEHHRKGEQRVKWWWTISVIDLM